MKLNICHLYPDLLNLYGDQGNIKTLLLRAQRRGIEVEIISAPLGEKVHFSDCDLMFIGSGQDAEQRVVLDELHAWRGAEIKAAIADGITLLAIAGGGELLGHSYKTLDGAEMDFIGALDFYCVAQKERMVGDYLFSWDETGVELPILGFENHASATFLGAGVRPLGQVMKGYGNNGQDKTEGARYLNTFCTYSHGPILPKNPKFADFLLETALKRKYGDVTLSPLDDTLETQANAYMVNRLMNTEKQ